jgi:hypothetical protein
MKRLIRMIIVCVNCRQRLCQVLLIIFELIIFQPIMNGVDSVQRVLQQMRENNADGRNDSIIDGYYGK